MNRHAFECDLIILSWFYYPVDKLSKLPADSLYICDVVFWTSDTGSIDYKLKKNGRSDLIDSNIYIVIHIEIQSAFLSKFWIYLECCPRGEAVITGHLRLSSMR